MIKNERQYQVTQRKIAEMRAALDRLRANQAIDAGEIVIRARFAEAQIEVLADEVAEYENLKQGKVVSLPITSLKEIAQALIKARIGRGWTQADLAEKLDTQEQQVQRYESLEYQTASLARVLEISQALGVDLRSGRVELKKPEFVFTTQGDAIAFARGMALARERKSLLITEGDVCER